MEYEAYKELQKQIAQYDWAVEGFDAPEGTEISREAAIIARSTLVRAASEIRL